MRSAYLTCSFIIVDVDSFKLQLMAPFIFSHGINAVLNADHLPKLQRTLIQKVIRRAPKNDMQLLHRNSNCSGVWSGARISLHGVTLPLKAKTPNIQKVYYLFLLITMTFKNKMWFFSWMRNKICFFETNDVIEEKIKFLFWHILESRNDQKKNKNRLFVYSVSFFCTAALKSYPRMTKYFGLAK